MKARFGLAMAAAAALAVAGCASGGSGGSSSDDGNPPRDNSHTRTAQLALTQAQMGGDGADRYAEALAAANNSIFEEPTNPLGYFQAGSAQNGLGDFVAADTLWEKALELYPAYDEEIGLERQQAWINNFNAALGPLNAGDDVEGLKYLQGAEAVYPGQRPEALINLGVTLSNMDRTDEAIEAYQGALEVIRGPKTDNAKPEEAEAWRASESDVTVNLARLLALVDRHEEAAAEYSIYLESHPDDIKALSAQAAVLSAGGATAEAQAIYDDLLSQSNLSPSDYFNIGVGLYNAEVWDRAAEAFTHVAEANPQSRDAVFNLAQALYEGEVWEDLVPIGQQLVDLDGYNSNSYTILAKALIETGAEQEGVAALEAREALAFTIASSRLTPMGSGGGNITADITNESLEQGATISIRAHFFTTAGTEVGTVDTRIVAPAQGVTVDARWDFSSSDAVSGYYFEVLSPR